MTLQLEHVTHPTTAPEEPETLGLVRELCAALAAAGVEYCHWKSNEALAKSCNGDNDLDLLVAGADRGAFGEVLSRLGFKLALLPHQREVPAVAHYYGLDRASGRLVHVHAHHRLVLGDDTTKNFWLPVEAAYLASSRMDGIFPVPSPAFELAVLTLRLVVKHCTWDAMVQARGALAASERREIAWLLERTDWAEAEALVAEHLPFVSPVWSECRRALEPGSSVLVRVRAAERLARALAPFSRRPWARDTTLRLTRRVVWGARRYVLNRPTRKRLHAGGAMLAVVGGDGSGKSTAVDGLAGWLSRAFVVERVHLGRPPKSATTVAVKGALRAAHRLGLLPELAEPTAPPDPARRPTAAWLTWHLLTARDRHRLYRRARRVAADGGIVVCDRYPRAELRSMDGPRGVQAAEGHDLGRISTWLVERERRYYSAFVQPDLLAVLRVDPEEAVRRKTTEEEHYVRRRSTEVWRAQWDASVVVLDAGRPAEDVLADLRTAVWERL